MAEVLRNHSPPKKLKKEIRTYRSGKECVCVVVVVVVVVELRADVLTTDRRILFFLTYLSGRPHLRMGVIGRWESLLFCESVRQARSLGWYGTTYP